MKFLVVIMLAYIASTSAQLGSLGSLGSKVGSQVGSGVGLITGTVFDTVPNLLGIRKSPGTRGHGSDSLDERSYKRKGAGGEYGRGSDYVKERTIYERERGKAYDGGRDWKGSERGGATRRRNPY